MKNQKLSLESLSDFKLGIEQQSKINGGMTTEQCTQRCSSQYDCASDDGSGDYGTSEEYDNCGDKSSIKSVFTKA